MAQFLNTLRINIYPLAIDIDLYSIRYAVLQMSYSSGNQ